MKISIKIISVGKAVIRPVGKINSITSKVLKKYFLILLDQNYKIIIIDMGKVENFDISILFRFLLFEKMINEKEGKLFINNCVNSDIKKLFYEYQLDRNL